MRVRDSSRETIHTERDCLYALFACTVGCEGYSGWSSFLRFLPFSITLHVNRISPSEGRCGKSHFWTPLSLTEAQLVVVSVRSRFS